MLRCAVAVVMGLNSGLLICFLSAMSLGPSVPGLVPIAVLGGWALSIWLMLRNAHSASRVASRGFLLGTFEWLLVIFGGFVMPGRAVSTIVMEFVGGRTGPQTPGALAGALPSSGMLIVFLALGAICFIGYLITKTMNSENEHGSDGRNATAAGM